MLRFPAQAIVGIGLALVAVGVLAGPAGAAEIANDGPAAYFSVRGTHGYPITLYAENGSTTVGVRDPALTGDSYSFANYRASRGEVRRERIRVDIGSLLHVSARFEPGGRTKRGRTPAGCKGGLREKRFGHFVGRIAFHGEGGYTELERTRVPGTLTFASPLNCPPPGARASLVIPGQPGPSRGPATLVTRFEANAPSTGLAFTIGHAASEPQSSLLVATSEEQGKEFSVLRATVLLAPAAAFAFDPGLGSATIAPPYPYAGSGHFERIDDYTSRWDGPLTVSFPGRPSTPLTGHGFSWGLSSARQRGGPYLRVGNVVYGFGS